MAREKPVLRVLSGSPRQEVGGRRSQIEAAYDHFRIDRQSSLVSPSTLRFYDHRARPFLAWLWEEGSRTWTWRRSANT